MDKLKKYLPIIVVFILTFSIRIFWICQKDYVFVDEPVSFSIISPNTIHNGGNLKTFDCTKFNFKNNYKYSTEEVKQLLYNNGGNFKSLAADLKSLYLNHYDGGHSNLYYILLRIWSFKLDNVGINTIILYGCTFNLLLFAISFFIMYKLLQIIIGNKKYITYALFLAFISTLSVSSTLFARDYQLQTLGMLLVTYIFCKIYLWIYENKNLDILNKKSIFFYAFVFAFYLLTGYYSIIYAFILFVILSFTILKNIKLDRFDILKLCSVLILSLIFILIADKNYFNMSQEFVKASNDTFLSFKIFERELFTAFDMMQKTIFYPVLILYCLTLFTISKPENKQYNFLLLIFSMAFIWSLTVLLITPFNDIRYFMPAAPLLSLGFIYFLQRFNFKHTLIFCMISALFIIIPNVRFNNFDTVRPFLFYVHDRDNFTFNNKSQIPVVFQDYKLTMQSIILNTPNSQQIMFVDKIPDRDFSYKTYILFFFKDNIEKYSSQIYKNNVINFNCTRFNDCFAVINNQ